jgi:hypothetical protein
MLAFRQDTRPKEYFMKRIALAMTALALGSLAFAEDAPAAKISGYLDAGLYVVNNSSGTKFQSFADDYNVAGSGYVGVVTATLDTEKYGYVLGVELAQSGVAIDTAYAWVSPLTGLKVFGGSGNGSLNELDDNDSKTFKNASGLTALYTAGGLSLGANVGATYAGATKGTTYVFAGGYTADKVFQLVATAKTTNTGAKLDAYDVTAALLAVPSLTLTLGYNASAVATDAATFFDVSASYALNDTWSIGLLGYDYLANNTTGSFGKNGITGDLGNALYYVPSVTYAASKDVSLTGAFYGDTADNPDYNGRFTVALTPVAGSTISAYIEYDTNPYHLASAKAQTVFDLQLLTSF